MRCIRVFVLRLLLDSNTPLVLRGSISPVWDEDPHPFADVQHLLRLIGEMAQLPRNNPTAGQELSASVHDGPLPKEVLP